jgi:O-antigen/teichoic acid export membrane protein
MIGLAMIAHPLVIVMLTGKWSPCVPYLQLFCIVGLLFPLQMINLNVLQALGRSDLFLRLEIIKKVLIVINIAVTWRWGLSAMIYGMIVISIISYYLNSYYTGHLIDYPILEQLRDLFSSLIMSILMGMSIYVAGLLPFPNYWFMLILQITIGFFVYLFLCRIFRIEAFMEIWQMGWNKIRSHAGNRG